MSVPARSGLTLENVYAMPDDGRRYEILDGELFVTPSAGVRHQYVVMRVSSAIHRWAEEHGGQVYPGANIDFADDTHLEPDVVYTASDDLSGLALQEVPLLVVEVSSPATRRFDTGRKKDRYGAEGIPELWFVDLDADEIHQYLAPHADAHRYDTPRIHGRGTRFTSPTLPGLGIAVHDVLGPRPEDT